MLRGAEFLHVLIISLLFCAPAYADERREAELFSIVKCPTCAGQSVGESDTPAAKTIKSYIHDKIDGGASDEEILAALSESYGEEVVSRPKVSLANSLLWGLPFAFAVYLLLRARRYFCISRK